MRKSFGIFLVFCIVVFGICCTGCLKSGNKTTSIVDSEAEKEKANIEKLAVAMSSVSQGNGVAEASSYTNSSGLHPIVLISSSGGVHDWTTKIPKEWQAKSIAETQLVVCVGENIAEYVDKYCNYGLRDGSGWVYHTDKIYRYHLTAQLREAKSGKLIQQRTFYAAIPTCRPEKWVAVGGVPSEDILYSLQVNFYDVFFQKWLQQYVIVV